MKYLLAFTSIIAASIGLVANPSHASEQQQTFVINNRPLDINQTIDVKQFDPKKGTLERVEIQSQWEVSTSGAYEIEVELDLPLPGPLSTGNTLTEGGSGTWGLAVGLDAPYVDLSPYVGSETIQFVIVFDAISLSAPATGSLHMTVTYTYTH